MKDEAAQHTRAIDPSRESMVLRELRMLSAGQRKVLDISDIQLDIAELCFSAIALLLDDRDNRPLRYRMEDLETDAIRVMDSLGAETFETGEDGEILLPRWLRSLSKPHFGRFLRSFLGAARTDRLVEALRQDGEVLAIAVRRSLRGILPVAAAADRCIRVLSPAQQSEIEGVEGLARSTALGLVVHLDSLVTQLDNTGVKLDPGIARPSELVALPGPVGEIARSADMLVTEQSAEIIEGLGNMLKRKVRGARDALNFSADPISQAANSLIELIDRMLREAYDTEFVLESIDRYFNSQNVRMTHESHGSLQPTKRARALCFVCAGEAPPEVSMIHELAAAAIVVARSNLEHLKHADTCTTDEEKELLCMLETIEGSILLISRVTWLGVKESALGDLRDRLVLAA